MATFVLVHGAWHGGWCWQRVEAPLRERGHGVHCPTLTGLGDRAHLTSPQVGLDTHVEDIVRVVDLLDESERVVLVGHSYAGQVIAGVASRRPERVAQLVYLDAFLPDDGDAAIELQPAEIAQHYREAVADRGFGWLIPPRQLEILGVTETEDLAWLSPRFTPHPFRTYTDPASVFAESLRIPSTFIECVDWMRAFRASAERAGGRGWTVRELRTGHEAMVTAPQELSAVLLELVDHRSEEV